MRHGESVGNRERWLAGSTDTPLTDRGRDQARAAGSALGAMPLVRALCSTLCRAQETAELVLAGRDVPLTSHAALCERELGAWATRSIDAVRAEHGDAIWSWDQQAPGGESGGQVAARALEFLRRVPPVEGPTLVVCHGGVIRGLLGLVAQTPYGVIGQRKIPNAVPIPVSLGPLGWAGVWAQHESELEPLLP